MDYYSSPSMEQQHKRRGLGEALDEASSDPLEPAYKRRRMDDLRAQLELGESDAYGLREGQAAYEVRGITQKNSTERARIPRSDGAFWSKPEQDAEPYGRDWLVNMAERNAILAADPNERFIGILASALNIDPRKLYDEDNIRIVQEMQRSRRQLDQRRKIVGAKQKQEQIGILESDLAKLTADLGRLRGARPQPSPQSQILDQYFTATIASKKDLPSGTLIGLLEELRKERLSKQIAERAERGDIELDPVARSLVWKEIERLVEDIGIENAPGAARKLVVLQSAEDADLIKVYLSLRLAEQVSPDPRIALRPMEEVASALSFAKALWQELAGVPGASTETYQVPNGTYLQRTAIDGLLVKLKEIGTYSADPARNQAIGRTLEYFTEPRRSTAIEDPGKIEWYTVKANKKRYMERVERKRQDKAGDTAQSLLDEQAVFLLYFYRKNDRQFEADREPFDGEQEINDQFEPGNRNIIYPTTAAQMLDYAQLLVEVGTPVNLLDVARSDALLRTMAILNRRFRERTYAAVPLRRESARAFGWVSLEELENALTVVRLVAMTYFQNMGFFVAKRVPDLSFVYPSTEAAPKEVYDFLLAQETEMRRPAIRKALGETGRMAREYEEAYSFLLQEGFPLFALHWLALHQEKLLESEISAVTEQRDRVREAIGDARAILAEIASEKERSESLRALTQQVGGREQSMAWTVSPEISGISILSRETLSAIARAHDQLKQDVPVLGELPLEVLTTNFDQGLASTFAQYVAILQARTGLTHPVQYQTKQQQQEISKQYFNILKRLQALPVPGSRRGPPVPWRDGTLGLSAAGVDNFLF